MQTLEIEDGGEEQRSMDLIIPQKGAKSSSAIAISNQSDMIEEILSRLPVKTLFRFTCVSKPWRNLISDQSFVKLHSIRTNHHGLVISAYDESTFKRYFLFASSNGGSITQLLTIPYSKTYPKYSKNHCEYDTTRAQHVNGLLLFCPEYGFDENYFAFAYNPSTRKIFKVPRGYDVPKVNNILYCYLLVFDESSSEHKILNFKTIGAESFGPFKPIGLEIEIFSFSTYTWRKIDVDFPLDPIVAKWFSFDRTKVCINSVIYSVLLETKNILVFDLITETFSTMNLPPVTLFPYHLLFLMVINGLLGVSNRVVDLNKMEFWILEDYKNQVWVKDTITVPDCLIDKYRPHYPVIDKYRPPYPVDSQGGEIVFTSKQVSENVLSIPMYDMNKGTFRSVEVNLSHDLLCSKTLHVNLGEIRSYVESMMPLKNSVELVPLMSGKGNDKSNANA